MAGALRVALATALLVAATPAAAQSVAGKLQVLNKRAMDAYDSLEFETAKKLLLGALRLASRADLRRGPALVQGAGPRATQQEKPAKK